MEIQGTIDRRLLVNWRADPARVAPLLPPGLRPLEVDGSAVVGVCALHMSAMRPVGVPAALGRPMEAAAHRVAVVSDEGPGVYVVRRDTTSRLAALVGGRLFPGVHHRVPFQVEETASSWRIAFGATTLVAELADAPSSSLFPDLDAASAFFRCASTAWSPNGAGHDRMAMVAMAWSFEPAHLRFARSDWDDLGAVPDSAYVMRRVPVRWTSGAALTAVG